MKQVEHASHFRVGRDGVSAKFLDAAGKPHFDLRFLPRQGFGQPAAELFDEGVVRSHFFKKRKRASRRFVAGLEMFAPENSILFSISQENFKTIAERLATSFCYCHLTVQLPASTP
jgi:hypothetical protein